MTISLDGKVCVLTGASKGIGRAMAEDMAKAGAKVVVSSRKQEAVDEVAAAIKDAGGEAVGIACHVGKADQREALIAGAMEAYGRIDCLVNNAATNVLFGPALIIDEAAFDKIFEINVKGPFELSKLAHPHLAEAKGNVINISSIEGITPSPMMSVYSMSKAALISMTKALAQEWGPDVRSNAICPGLVETKFAQVLLDNEDMVERVVGNQPIPRPATPDEISGIALFLASDAASYCTGGVYTVDGGHTI
jgi:NAD(P)-dependent dehydrogenase (short-subunit alcohol dehydrogenase family)